MSEASIYTPRQHTILCRTLSYVLSLGNGDPACSEDVACAIGVSQRQAITALIHLASRGLIARVRHGEYHTHARAAELLASRIASIRAAEKEVSHG